MKTTMRQIMCIWCCAGSIALATAAAMPAHGQNVARWFETSRWSRWWMDPGINVLSGDFDGDGATDVMKFDNGVPAGVWVGLSRDGDGDGVNDFYDSTRWSNWWMSSSTNVLAGDFDGDGADDVMKFDNGTPGGVWVGLSRDRDGDGVNDHFHTTRWSNWWMSSGTNVLAGDFDGNGKCDVMKFDNGSPAGVWVGLSTGSSFSTTRWANWWMSSSTNVLVGDFDGDNADDVMKFDNGTPGGVWVGLSRDGSDSNRINDHFHTTRWADWWMNSGINVLAGDFDGNGKCDVMKFDNGSPAGVWVGLSTGSSFSTTRWDDWWMSSDTNVLVGDFDGDNADDVMKFDNGSPAGVWVGLSRDRNGNGVNDFFSTTRWDDWWMTPDTNVLAGDFDDDGKCDVMKFDNGRPGGVWVGLSREGAPFNFGGTYTGTVFGDNGSSATATLTLTQTGNQITGNLRIGAGVAVSAGICGTQNVPATTFGPFSLTDRGGRRATGTFRQSVMGFDIDGDLEFNLSSTGSRLTAFLDLDLPWPCANTEIFGDFTRS